MIPLKADSEQVFEYDCHEANDSLLNMLKNHLCEESQARTSSSR